MVGAVVSWTVMTKLHDAVLPAVSVAVHVTGVVPNENAVPEWSQLTVGDGSVLSVAVGVAKMATAPAESVASSVWLSEQPINFGASVSLTVKVTEH